MVEKRVATKMNSLKEEQVYEYNALTVILRQGKYFVRYDAGAHQEIWREDEISESELGELKSGRDGRYNVLLKIQRRLGFDVNKSNWSPDDQA